IQARCTEPAARLSWAQAQEICPEPAALVSWLGTEKRPPSGGLFILLEWKV
ncbi:MAG: hypothetical protein HOM88_01455, partial [Hellea sp.]|nr:hypothetical protein [Hellea sp.]